MAFYKLDPACDTSETGPIYPQVQKMREGYDYDSDRSIHKLNYHNELFGGPDLDYFVIESKAKPTDILSAAVSSYGFLVSVNFKNALLKCEVREHRFYEAKVQYKKTDLQDYYWFLPLGDLSDKVDFRKTKFYAQNSFSKVQDVKINRLSDIKNVRSKIGYLWKIKTERLEFKKRFKLEQDLLIIGAFDFGIYISDRLREEINKRELTGVKLRPAPFLQQA